MIELDKGVCMSDLSNKTYLVTGATSGIGLASIELLAQKGANLIGVGRSPERCHKLSESLQEQYPNNKIEYLVADLSNQSQIRSLVKLIDDQLMAWNECKLDGLINNAGTFTFWQSLTGEGFEMQWAVNHLAPFLLTNLLLDHLKKSDQARVITVSSGSHYGAKLVWTDIQGLGRYNPLKAYKRTKLANVIFTAELNRRLGSTSPVIGLAADPGLVNTGIGEKSKSLLASRFWKRRRRRGIPPIQSAAGIAKLLEDEIVVQTDSIYWKHGKPKKPDPYTLNEDHGWRLWEISAQMTGIS
jgi:NAD(P)-dependent dehydrogenase (short-subunit alcohol dehydrogenase family)